MIKKENSMYFPLRKTINVIIDFYQNIAFRFSYFFPLLAFSYIGFGFSIHNRTVSVDDLARDLYFGAGNEKLAGLRWGQYLMIKLFSSVKYTPFLEKIVGLLFLLLASTIFSSILFYLSQSKENAMPFTIFSCIFVTFPLINEIWEYNESCIPIGLAYVITSFSLLYCLVNEHKKIFDYLFLGFLMSFVAAGVESVFVSYITFELIILYLQVLNNVETKWFYKGIQSAVPLVIAVIVRTLVGVAIIKLFGFSYTHNGASGIYWFTLGIKETAIRILANFEFYLHSAKHYMPITEFAFAVLAFIIINLVYLSKKKVSAFVLAFFITASLYSISFVQGQVLPLRVAHIFSLYVAFVCYFVVDLVAKSFCGKLYAIIAIAFLFLSYRQSVYLHNLLSLNNQRSENEARIISEIGYRLYSEYDIDKPVVFCGNYDLGNTIKSQIKNKTETDVQSIINWAIVAFDNQNMMKELFSYYGFEINVLEEPFKTMNIGEYNKIARDNNMKPLEIREFGDYILVYFGR